MTTPGFKRKLSAILMADVVGYSRLMGENETATLKTLTIYQGIMDELIRQHRGRVVDAPGDAVLAEFSSVVDAVQCALAVQKELQTRNTELPENDRMQFRIGINLGDVIEEGDKIYGDGVNIAARLEALAEPGGICISKTAFDHIETKLPLGYEFLGEKTVKNINRPVGAYRVLLEPRVTIARDIGKEKTLSGWRFKAVVAAALVMFTAAVSLAIWKSGFFSSQPTKQIASASPQSPSTQATPAPQAASPAPKTHLPRRAHQPPATPPPKAPTPPAEAQPPTKAYQSPTPPLAKGPPPTQMAPATEATPPTRVVPPLQVEEISSVFDKLDKNNDGKVTLDEFMMFRERHFNHLDANKDGNLSRLEISAGKNKFARQLGQNFDLIDTNQDQMLSRDEFRAASRRKFLMLDADRNGHITKEEMASSKARQE